MTALPQLQLDHGARGHVGRRLGGDLVAEGKDGAFYRLQGGLMIWLGVHDIFSAFRRAGGAVTGYADSAGTMDDWTCFIGDTISTVFVVVILGGRRRRQRLNVRYWTARLGRHLYLPAMSNMATVACGRGADIDAEAGTDANHRRGRGQGAGVPSSVRRWRWLLAARLRDPALASSIAPRPVRRRPGCSAGRPSR